MTRDQIHLWHHENEKKIDWTRNSQEKGENCFCKAYYIVLFREENNIVKENSEGIIEHNKIFNKVITPRF